MIIKVIERKPDQRSRFEQLGRYILNVKQNSDPVLFTRMAEYVMDAKGDGEKVAWYRITNCESDTPAVAIAEVLATQSENRRSKSDKTYHLVVSLPAWERLTREQAADIEDTICAGLGFAEHQRVSAVHQDTEHSHLHIAINKIHPKTLRCIEPYYPYYKLDTLAKQLELKYGLYQANRIGKGKSFANVSGMESQQGEDSFLRWLHQSVGDRLDGVLQKARGWQDVHDLLTAYGAVIKPRGAGLAIATLDGKIGVKASSLDRRLSFKSLTDRFGEYEPPAFREKPRKEYQRDSKKQAEAGALYAEYQKLRNTNYQSRSQSLNDVRTEFAARRTNIKDRYRARRASVKANMEMDSRTKRSAYQELSRQMKTELSELSQSQERQRRAIREQFPSHTWDAYLSQQAATGNADALTILRRRKDCRQMISQALLTVDNLADARDVIKPHLKPTVMKDGKVIYRVNDGGVVCDEAAAISVHQVTEAATLLALSLADERFQGKALVVEGSDEFKREVVRLSTLKGLSIRLADQDLEKTRQHFAREKELTRQTITEQADLNLGSSSYHGR